MKLIEYKELFELWKRVKEIRPSYTLMLNRETNKVELHDENFGGLAMVFELPLTPDILDAIQKTKIENSNDIFRKIEHENAKKRLKTIENCVERAKEIIINPS